MNINGDMAAHDLDKVEPAEHRADDERDVLDEIDEIVAGISDAEVDAHLRAFMRPVNGRMALKIICELLDDAAPPKYPHAGEAPRSREGADPAGRQADHDLH